MKDTHLQHQYLQLIRPTYFIRNSLFILRILNLIGITLLITAAYYAIYVTDTDSQQGENYRIIYIHVPSAWLCMLLYCIITIFSVVYLINKHPLIPIMIKSISKMGAIYTLITLITGCLWGYPVWGTYWVWDARLTSVLILFFIYLGHLSVIYNTAESNKGNTIASIVAIVGFINIPIIKYSVEWWTTLHQGSSITQFKNSIDPTMLVPMLLMFSSYLLYTLYITICDTRKEILIRKIDTYNKEL